MDINYIARFLEAAGTAMIQTGVRKEAIDEGLEHFIVTQLLAGEIDFKEADKLSELKEAIINCLE